MKIFNIAVLLLMVVISSVHAGRKSRNYETTRTYDWDTPVKSTPFDVKNDDSMTIKRKTYTGTVYAFDGREFTMSLDDYKRSSIDYKRVKKATFAPHLAVVEFKDGSERKIVRLTKFDGKADAFSGFEVDGKTPYEVKQDAVSFISFYDIDRIANVWAFDRENINRASRKIEKPTYFTPRFIEMCDGQNINMDFLVEYNKMDWKDQRTAYKKYVNYYEIHIYDTNNEARLHEAMNMCYLANQAGKYALVAEITGKNNWGNVFLVFGYNIVNLNTYSYRSSGSMRNDLKPKRGVKYKVNIYMGLNGVEFKPCTEAENELNIFLRKTSQIRGAYERTKRNCEWRKESYEKSVGKNSDQTTDRRKVEYDKAKAEFEKAEATWLPVKKMLDELQKKAEESKTESNSL